MSKYIILQNGGDATGAEMFNQYIDQLIASQQNDDIDYTNNISTPEDENGFIKNLEGYDEEKTKQEEIEKRNSEYNALNQHFNSLLDKFDDLQQQMMFYGSQEGQDYFEQVYDTNNTLPLTEKSQLGTTNPYWTSKLILENILKDLVVTKNWKTIALRYFNPIGAHSSWYIWEQPNWIPNNLLPYILEVAVGKREYVWIFGNDYETIDGTGVRDYIDVNDLIEAHITAIENLFIQSKSYFSAINIGTWQGKSVLEMIQGVENASGKKIPYIILPRRHGDIASVYADSSLAKELLGWEAKKTIHESIESSWKFITHKN